MPSHGMPMNAAKVMPCHAANQMAHSTASVTQTICHMPRDIIGTGRCHVVSHTMAPAKSRMPHATTCHAMPFHAMPCRAKQNMPSHAMLHMPWHLPKAAWHMSHATCHMPCQTTCLYSNRGIRSNQTFVTPLRPCRSQLPVTRTEMTWYGLRTKTSSRLSSSAPANPSIFSLVI
jgi:hypothetical protein